MNKIFRIFFLGLLFPFVSIAQTCEHCGIGDVAPDAKLEVKSCGLGTGKVFHITDSLSAHLLTMLDNGKLGLGTASPGALLDVRGNAVFNEDGADKDFRIEGDTKANLFFLDASTDRIGINTSSPNAMFDLRGSAIFNEDGDNNDFRIESDNNANLFFLDASADFLGIGTSSPGATIDVRGSAIFNEDGGNYSFRIEGDTLPNLFVLNGSSSRIGIGTSSPSKLFHVKKSGTDGVVARFERDNFTGASQGYMDIVISDFDDNTGDVLLNAKSGADFAICSDNSNHFLIVDKAGYVGIDVSSPTHTLQLPNNDAALASSTTWISISDAKAKKNISAFSDGLNVVRQINPKQYQYNGLAGTPNDSSYHVGVLAQDIESFAPYCVKDMKYNMSATQKASFPGENVKLIGKTRVFNSTTKEYEEENLYQGDVKGFTSHALFFVLINSTKELDAQNQQLKAQLEQQQQLILQMQQRLTLLENK